MMSRARLLFTVGPLVVLGLVVACGGATTGSSTQGSDSDCVDVELTAADTTCAGDTDCTLTSTGKVCSGQCDCGATPVNTNAATRIAGQTSSLKFEGCPCAFPGNARCIAGQCTLCGVGAGPSGEPAGCNPDAGNADETGGPPPTTDAAICVDIVLSTYNQSCTTASDCILIQTGNVCSGDCDCGGQPVNAAEQSRYDQAISGITFGACGCPLQPAPSCVGGSCVVPTP